jgi:pantoate--beta-alanine ligase
LVFFVIMIVIKSFHDLNKCLNKLLKADSKIGFVATMGALHSGHVSLIKRSKSENDTTICSIFVNPKQFNDPEDLKKYPRPIEKDIILLTEAHTDILFLPSIEDIYPNSYVEPQIDLNGLDTIWEGAMRPGHFKGVALVVKRLLELVKPHKAYFGQKDYQQTLVIKEVVKQFDLPVSIVITDIIREKSGLAMSSRNIRLPEKARLNAGFIYNSLLELKENSQIMRLEEALDICQKSILDHEDCFIEYLTVVHPENLQSIEALVPHERAIALVVANYFGVRLLDNMFLN